jgi:hypothetical protein
MAASTTSKKGWKAQNRAWHKVTPPSGMAGVEVRIPDLTELIKNDAVPERLRAAALKAAAHPAGLRGVVTDELKKANDAQDGEEKRTDAELLDDESSALRKAIDDVVEIQKHLIVESARVYGVLLTMDDLNDPEFPAPDKEWLGGVMLREIDYDARGVRLGIEPLSSWERFRHFHDCDPDCSACAALQDALSSVDLGLV